MAKINNIPIFVLSESIKKSVESTTHPVEKGIDITDHVKAEPTTLSVRGEIIGGDAIGAIEKLMSSGEIVSYTGSSSIAKAQIISFNHEYSKDIAGGCNFDMEIKEVRIANSAYQKPKTSSRKATGSQQKQVNTKKGTPIYHTVKKGDSRWSMAQKYGTSVDFITKNNNVNSGITTNGTWYGLKVGAQVVVGYR